MNLLIFDKGLKTKRSPLLTELLLVRSISISHWNCKLVNECKMVTK